jgi:hypothetical protein
MIPPGNELPQVRGDLAKMLAATASGPNRIWRLSLKVVAGACTRQYLRLWSGPA